MVQLVISADAEKLQCAGSSLRTLKAVPARILIPFVVQDFLKIQVNLLFDTTSSISIWASFYY